MVRDTTGLEGMERDLQRLAANINDIPDQVLRGKTMRTGVRRSLQPTLLQAMRNADASARTGHYADSLSIRMTQYPQKGITYGVVGPKKRYKKAIGTRADGGVIYAVPSLYAHLIEGGFVHRSGSRADVPKPATRAWHSTKNRQIPILAKYIEKRLAAYARKVAKETAP